MNKYCTITVSIMIFTLLPASGKAKEAFQGTSELTLKERTRHYIKKNAPSHILDLDSEVIEAGDAQVLPNLPALTMMSRNDDVDEPLCADVEFGVKFYCENNWEWKRIDNAILIIMEQQPQVTLTIAKVDTNIKFLEQLSRNFLEGQDLYDRGFQTEKVMFANRKAVRVKAFSKKFPDVRLTNYFFIHHGQLYGALFSVHPKEQWSDKQYLIKKVAESFQFFEGTDALNAYTSSWQEDL